MSQILVFFYIIFILATATGQGASKEHVVIISGYDDVIKQAENTSLVRSIIKYFDKEQVYAGMSDLYQVINQKNDSFFYLVSATSHWFSDSIGLLLNKSNYPQHQKYLRNWLYEWSAVDFKIKKMTLILSQNKNDHFIVIFDNSEASQILAKDISELFPAQVLQVYLRNVVAKKNTVLSIGFFTAFDIAIYEYEQGRLDEQSVLKVGQAILAINEKSLLFPNYAICPKEYNPCSENVAQKLSTLICSDLKNHIQKLCKN